MAVAAQDDGLFKLDDAVSTVLAEWQSDPRKARVTLRQLLSFTSGLPGSAANPGSVGNVPDLNLAAMRLPLTAEPGARYTYGNTHLAVFNEVVRRKTGMLADTYLLRRVLEPIGVTQIAWTRDRAGNAQLAGGARLTARDWARYGQLFLQGGTWNGKRVLSSVGECLRGSSALGVYGLTWWLNAPFAGTVDAGDVIPLRAFGLPNIDSAERIAPSAPTDLFMAAGAGNQRLYVVPSLSLVVVRFGAGGAWSDGEFLKRLLR
jgi:CubicO group peptidase (beta-lactamase class C family)